MATKSVVPKSKTKVTKAKAGRRGSVAASRTNFKGFSTAQLQHIAKFDSSRRAGATAELTTRTRSSVSRHSSSVSVHSAAAGHGTRISGLPAANSTMRHNGREWVKNEPRDTRGRWTK